MAVKIIDVSKIPTPRRNRHSALHDSQEWITTMAKITHGLKLNEAIEVTFSDKTLKQVKHAPRIFKKLLETFMEDNKMDYDVFQRGQTEEGTPIIYVANPDKRFS